MVQVLATMRGLSKFKRGSKIQSTLPQSRRLGSTSLTTAPMAQVPSFQRKNPSMAEHWVPLAQGVLLITRSTVMQACRGRFMPAITAPIVRTRAHRGSVAREHKSVFECQPGREADRRPSSRRVQEAKSFGFCSMPMFVPERSAKPLWIGPGAHVRTSTRLAFRS
jgi:hypothetical protein